MLAKRIIPCLDVKDGRVVKGVNFVKLRDVGDPVECAIEYNRQGADEIVFLDITATHEGRGTIVDVVKETAKNVFVPLTIGGGIRTTEDFRELLLAGADKISVNSAAIRDPDLISRAAEKFGSQCVVLAIDGKKIGGASDEVGKALGDDRYSVFINGGRIDTGLDLVEWAREGERRGAGEILLTSMDTDGVRGGFDHAMLNAVCDAVNIPVIASGGGGELVHFSSVFKNTGADAALAASVFHDGELTVDDIKLELKREGIEVR